MAGLPGAAAARPRQINPELIQAFFLVTAVNQEVQALLPQVLRAGSVQVPQARIQLWIQALQAAENLLRSIPVILIFPPPPFAVFIERAAEQIARAIALLTAIPSRAPLTFPPQFGQATLTAATAQAVAAALREAQIQIFRAIQEG